LAALDRKIQLSIMPEPKDNPEEEAQENVEINNVLQETIVSVKRKLG